MFFFCFQNEVDELEAKKRLQQEEIQSLTALCEELQFVLDAHRRGACHLLPTAQQQQQSRAIAKATAAAVPRVVVVKSEPPVIANEFTSINSIATTAAATTISRHLTHEEALQNPPAVTAAVELLVPQFAARRPQRPASLSFQPTTATTGNNKPSFVSNNNSNSSASVHTRYTTIEGVPIETPTSVVSSLNFDALMDGRTGLTPTNILTPISLSFTSASLNTPTINTPSSGCSSQQRGQSNYHHSLSEIMGSPDNGLMNLVTL